MQILKTLAFGLLIIGLVTIFYSTGAAQGPILWLSFEETGDTAKDGSGNGNDGTIVGATRVTGKYGGGISIGLKDEYVDIPNVLEAAATIEFWFKPNWDSSNAETYRLFDATLNPIFLVMGKGKGIGDQPNNFGLIFENAADNDRDLLTPMDGLIVAGEWHHLAATWDFDEAGGSGGKVYLNGDLLKELGSLGGFPPLNPVCKIGFNADPGYFPANNGADSIMDEFAIYNRALDEDEVQRDMVELATAVEPSHKMPVMWGSIKAEY